MRTIEFKQTTVSDLVDFDFRTSSSRGFGSVILLGDEIKVVMYETSLSDNIETRTEFFYDSLHEFIVDFLIPSE